MSTMLSQLLVIGLSLSCVFGAHNLNEEYRFSADLADNYKLHWTFNLESNTISFAVNVSTTGWVGLGLSPNGGMVGSDVVIGWVEDNGQVMFKDRFASSMSMPSIDASQDWFLVSGEEENGNTILEFTRNLTSCDSENDLNIQADTARVIWSSHPNDPESENNIPGHQSRGSTSLNLLGGLLEERIEPDSADFVINVKNVTIPPVDTTYWCVVDELPPEVRQQERYIYKLSPMISEAGIPHAHHIIIYLCTELNGTHLGASNVCEDTHIDIRTCRQTNIIGGWAVGGADFIFPEGVGFAVGGAGAPRYVVIEMHYDNPTLLSGVVDSSGMRFSYTNTRPMHEAGQLIIGAPASPSMIIPPGADDFTITALCPGSCTEAYLPPDGVTVFGSLLHTHLAGHGLVVQHLRGNDQCGRLEELMPIDENRQYDFNFQQYTILPRQVKLLPGDDIQVQCFYRTTDPSYTQATLGGESTREEMCFSFLYYYPKTDLAFCTSLPEFPTYQEFARRHIKNSSLHNLFYQSLGTGDEEGVLTALREVDWTQETIDSYQNLINEGNQTSVCIASAGTSDPIIKNGLRLPEIDCPYVRPDTCTGQTGSQGQCCGFNSGSNKITYLPIVLHSMWIILALWFSVY